MIATCATRTGTTTALSVICTHSRRAHLFCIYIRADRVVDALKKKLVTSLASIPGVYWRRFAIRDSRSRTGVNLFLNGRGSPLARRAPAHEPIAGERERRARGQNQKGKGTRKIYKKKNCGTRARARESSAGNEHVT